MLGTRKLDRFVAIKVPRAGSSIEKDRFFREARSVAPTCGIPIIVVHSTNSDRPIGTPFLVSEFIDGVTLHDQLTVRRPTPREAAELVALLADALDYAHVEGVIHHATSSRQTYHDRAPTAGPISWISGWPNASPAKRP